ncbi:hypothetical protein [Pseudonocardia adelaidensis]|uniref:Uncharacterized protein n=1 Tax=Pseudonocardia adelaidensis TaxID=648754 RepID=A0ABP9NW78_9PSEU
MQHMLLIYGAEGEMAPEDRAAHTIKEWGGGDGRTRRAAGGKRL